MYITSSWYTKRELTKRTAIIQFCTGAGPMFGGFLQAAAYNGLNGVDGRSGWRWLFIIDGVISLPLAILTLFLLPDFPRSQKPNVFFTQTEIDLAKKRVPIEANVEIHYSWKNIRKWFTSWHVYAFAALFSLATVAGTVSQSLPFWFKSYNTKIHQTFSVAQINVYPTPMYAIQIVSTVAYAYISDNLLHGKRWILVSAIYFSFFPIVLGLVLVPVHPENKASRWALYYLCGLFPGSAAQTWTWVNESLLGQPLKRAFVSTMMNSVAYQFTAWVPILLFPTQDQPFVTHGNIAAAVFTVTAGSLALVMAYIQSLEKTTGFFRSVYEKEEGPEKSQEIETEEEDSGVTVQ